MFISRAFQKAPELVCVLSWILLIPLDCVLSLGTLKVEIVLCDLQDFISSERTFSLLYDDVNP